MVMETYHGAGLGLLWLVVGSCSLRRRELFRSASIRYGLSICVHRELVGRSFVATVSMTEGRQTFDRSRKRQKTILHTNNTTKSRNQQRTKHKKTPRQRHDRDAKTKQEQKDFSGFLEANRNRLADNRTEKEASRMKNVPK